MYALWFLQASRDARRSSQRAKGVPNRSQWFPMPTPLVVDRPMRPLISITPTIFRPPLPARQRSLLRMPTTIRNLASNLATYRSQWGLPACTQSNGCLKIVNQSGGSRLPSNNSGWGLGESLDLDMVSAICENCHILLVEANTPSNANLGTAVNEAVRLGAVAVSNSYGENEFSSESSSCSSYYQHNNVAVTASTGDNGPGVSYPAVCPYVSGIGGTTLNSNGSETAWSGSGGGCSSYIARPSWQSSSVTGCGNRAVADVSADADPNTGVYVYDTYGYGGWLEVGGTSESSPIIASVFALAGNVSSTTYPASLPWQRYTTGCLFKVGGVQYAYQTGLGSPNGTGCF